MSRSLCFFDSLYQLLMVLSPLFDQYIETKGKKWGLEHILACHNSNTPYGTCIAILPFHFLIQHPIWFVFQAGGTSTMMNSVVFSTQPWRALSLHSFVVTLSFLSIALSRDPSFIVAFVQKARAVPGENQMRHLVHPSIHCLPEDLRWLECHW